MNEIKNDVKFYGDYFTGFQDLYEHNSVLEVGLGVMKILSYLTVGLPILFAGAYYYKQSQLDDLSKLNERVSSVVINHFPGNLEKKDLITFLSMKIKDEDHQGFEDVFKTLGSPSQKDFFKEMDRQGKLTEAIQYVPENQENLSVSFGDSKNSGYKFDEVAKSTKNVITKLDKFKDLKSLTIDLSGVAYYTPKVKLTLEHLTTQSNFLHDSPYLKSLGDDKVEFGGSGRSNNIEAVNLGVGAALTYLKKTESLKEITIQFEKGSCTLKKENGQISCIATLSPYREVKSVKY